MLFGKYKKTHIFLFIDDTNNLWYAFDLKNRKYSDYYTTVDMLRDAIRLNTVTWSDHKLINKVATK